MHKSSLIAAAIRAAYRVLAALLLVAGPAFAQEMRVALAPGAWEATDSIRFAEHLGRAAVYLDRGAALARDTELREGTFEFSMAATARSTFLGVVFHARSPRDAEVVFFRFGMSGTTDAIQYAPALNSITAAWQVYHGAGANAAAELPRERWIPVRITIRGRTASLYLHGDSTPTLVVPRLAGTGGVQLGLWAGGFGRGAWFSDLRFTPAASTIAQAADSLPPGTIVEWELSPALDATELVPGTLPDLAKIRWERVRAEPPGIVLVNRYRTAPIARLPLDSAGRVIGDSVMNGRVPGSKVVLARAVIDSDRARIARMRFGFSDGIVVYHDGRPLYLGMNPQFFRSQGIMDERGEAVFLPLHRGRNEIVLAVTEFTGGWAFWARLDR